MLKDFINQLKTSAEHRDILTHYRHLPEQAAVYGDTTLPPDLVAALQRLGIPRLYRHQAEALNAIRAGQNLLVATPTASGKTLIYNLPVMESLLRDPEGHALYLFPLKALEQDHLKALKELDAALPSPFCRPPSMTATRRRASARPSRPSRPMCSSPTRTCCIWD